MGGAPGAKSPGAAVRRSRSPSEPPSFGGAGNPGAVGRQRSELTGDQSSVRNEGAGSPAPFRRFGSSAAPQA